MPLKRRTKPIRVTSNDVFTDESKNRVYGYLRLKGGLNERYLDSVSKKDVSEKSKCNIQMRTSIDEETKEKIINLSNFSGIKESLLIREFLSVCLDRDKFLAYCCPDKTDEMIEMIDNLCRHGYGLNEVFYQGIKNFHNHVTTGRAKHKRLRMMQIVFYLMSKKSSVTKERIESILYPEGSKSTISTKMYKELIMFHEEIMAHNRLKSTNHDMKFVSEGFIEPDIDDESANFEAIHETEGESNEAIDWNEIDKAVATNEFDKLKNVNEVE